MRCGRARYILDMSELAMLAERVLDVLDERVCWYEGVLA